MVKIFRNKYFLIFIIITGGVFILSVIYPFMYTDTMKINEQILAEAITIKPGADGAYNPHSALTPEKHIQLALQHNQEGRMSEALRTLNVAILHNKNNKDLYAVRGSIYLERGKSAAALRDIQQALIIDPDDSALLTDRAQIYQQFGKTEQALSDLDKAIKLSPNLVAARFIRGVIYYSNKKYNLALEDFDQCIAIDRRLTGSYFNRASAKQALGDVAGARDDMNHFIQISDSETWKSTARELLQRWNAIDNNQNIEVAEP